MPPRILVDPETCIGAGNCEFRAPSTFEVGDDTKAHVIDEAGDPDDLLELAVIECPTGAIRLASVTD